MKPIAFTNHERLPIHEHMERVLSVFLVEDSPVHRDVLVELIERERGLRLVGSAAGVREGRERMRGVAPDLLLLDIELPDGTGMDLASENDCVIFTTVHEQYALPAFDVGAVDYLLKPVMRERFRAAIARARRFLGEKQSAKGLVLSEKGRRNFVAFEEMIYLSAHGKYTVVHAPEREFKTLRYLGRLRDELPASFLRIHRQFIINTGYLSHLLPASGGRYLAVLKDEDETALPVGRGFAPALRDFLGMG